MKYLGINRPVMALSIARMADAVGNSILFIIIPLYVVKLPKEYFHFPTPVLVGILISLYGFISAICQPIMGAVSDKIGKKPLILAGLILMCTGTILLGTASSLSQLIIYRLLQGIAAACIAAPAFAVAADLSHTGGEGRQMSFITMSFGLGIATGPLIAGILAVIFFELPFLVIGFLSLVSAWIGLRYMPETVVSEKALFKNKS